MMAKATPTRKGIGGHQLPNRGRTDDWITPRHLLDALGEFDLDPCACKPQPWITAWNMLTVDEDGLAAEWSGRVWLNPPYGPETRLWLKKLADHGNGIALVFARTETAMFFNQVWERCSGLLFLRDRLHFHYPDGKRAKGNAGGPHVLVAYGRKNLDVLAKSGIAGQLVKLR